MRSICFGRREEEEEAEEEEAIRLLNSFFNCSFVRYDEGEGEDEGAGEE